MNPRGPHLHLVGSTRSSADLLGRPFTPASAARAGFGRAALERWIRDGTVVRLLRGVYLGSQVEADPGIRASAVGLVIGARRTVTGRTAAWIHGCDPAALLVGLDPARGVPLELRAPGSRVAPSAIVMRDGLRVVTAAAAAADLARRLPDAAAVAALDGLLLAGAIGHGELLRTLPGSLAARCDARAAGPAESILRVCWLDARLPTPCPGLLVAGARMALALPVHRFGAVLAGRAGAPARDEWRARGWRVLVLDPERVVSSDADLLGAHLEREFHQHLLSQVG